MILYFDDNIVKQSVENEVVYYSSYTHNAIRVGKQAAQIIDAIINVGSGCELHVDRLEQQIDGFSSKDMNETIFELLETGLFYDSCVKLRLNNYNKLRAAAREISPKTAYLHLTYKCNLACEYCYNKDKINSCHDICLEDWKQIIDVLHNDGANHIVLTGGEPTLYPEYENVVEYAASKDFSIDTLTNGTLLNRLSSDTLKLVNNFIVSLDSLDDGQTHRLNSAKYSILKQVEEFVARGANLRIRSVLTAKNKNAVRSLQNYLDDKEIPYLEVPFIPSSISELDLVPDFDSKNICEDYDLNRVEECGAGFSIVSFSPDGNIYPCQTLMEDEFLISSIKKTNWLQDIKESPIVHYFHQRLKTDIPGCSNCGYLTLCGGGCPSVVYHVYHDLEHKNEYQCPYLRKEWQHNLASVKFE